MKTIEDPTAFLTTEIKTEEPIKVEAPIKDEPVKVLRAERDRLKKELEEKEKKIAEFAELEAVRPVAEHIKKKQGKLDSDAVNNYIESQRQRKASLSEKEKEIKDKDERLKEIEITHSDEWRTEYQEPIRKSNEYLVATLVKTNSEGKAVEPELHTTLLRDLVAIGPNGEKKTPIEIKGILKKFSDSFEKKTGMEWDVPRLEDVVNGVDSFHDKIIKAETAKKNWEESKQNRLKERAFDESKKNEAFVKKEIANRDYAFDKIVDEEFDFSLIEDKDKLIEAIREEHKSMNDVLARKENAKPKDYKSYLTSVAKAKAFDEISANYAKLIEENKKLKADINSSLPHRGKSDTKYVSKSDESPTAFLNS